MNFRMFPLMDDDKGDKGGGGGDGKPPQSKQPETFSREYVHELREENKSWRQKHQESETARAAAEAAAKAAGETSQTEIKAANSKADERVIRAEAKAFAIKAGMIDLDGLKLADFSSVKIDKDGEVQGAEDMIAALKKSKPYLFKDPSSSNGEPPPKKGDQKPKMANEMTPAEYQASKAAAIRAAR